MGCGQRVTLPTHLVVRTVEGIATPVTAIVVDVYVDISVSEMSLVELVVCLALAVLRRATQMCPHSNRVTVTRRTLVAPVFVE
jgi:hypothetical protein